MYLLTVTEPSQPGEQPVGVYSSLNAALSAAEAICDQSGFCLPQGSEWTQISAMSWEISDDDTAFTLRTCHLDQSIDLDA